MKKHVNSYSNWQVPCKEKTTKQNKTKLYFTNIMQFMVTAVFSISVIALAYYLK